MASHAGVGPPLTLASGTDAASLASGTDASSGAASQRTSTETFIPRLSEGKPRHVPEIGTLKNTVQDEKTLAI